MIETLVLALLFILTGITWYRAGYAAGSRDVIHDARESDRLYQESLKSWKGEI